MSQTLIDHFETLAQSQGGVAKLRGLILELAVRGKLVKQDSLEEPAATLLASINTQRGLLPNSTNAVANNALPTGWEWVELQDVTEIVLGQSPPSDSYNERGEGLPFFQGKAEFGKVYPTVRKWCTEPTKVAQKDDVLISVRAPIGPTNICPEPACIGRGLAAIRPLGGISNTFIVHVLRAYQTDLENLGTGTTFKAISGDVLRSFGIPLPPLEEQCRIVTKVDELMRLCDALEQSASRREAARQQLLKALLATGEWEQVLAGLETLVQTPDDVGELRKAVLQLAVQGKLVEQDSRERPPVASTTQGEFDIPDNWAWVHISDVFEVSGGIQKTPSRKPEKNAYPYLRVANVQRGRLDLEEIQHFELYEGELDKYRLEKDDLLIVEGNGSENEIGRCAIWGGDIENCVHQNHIMRARAKIQGLEAFVLLFLNSPIGIAEMKNLAITTSGLFTLSVGKIRSIQIPLPPLLEQRRIVAKVDRLMALCDTLEAALGRSRQTLAAAMASAVAQAV